MFIVEVSEDRYRICYRREPYCTYSTWGRILIVAFLANSAHKLCVYNLYELAKEFHTKVYKHLGSDYLEVDVHFRQIVSHLSRKALSKLLFFSNSDIRRLVAEELLKR